MNSFHGKEFQEAMVGFILEEAANKDGEFHYVGGLIVTKSKY